MEQNDTKEMAKNTMPDKMTETKMDTPQAAGKSNSKTIMIAMLITFVTLVAVGIAAFLLLKKDDVRKFDDAEDIEEFINEVAAEANIFDGVMNVEIENSENELAQTFSIDFANKIFYYKDIVTEVEIYANSDTAYTYVYGQWVESSLEEASLDPDDIFEVSLSNPGAEFEDKGIEECPEDIGGDCYVIYDPSDDSTTYITTDTELLVYQEASGTTLITYSYKEGESLEIPQDAIDEAISYGSFTEGEITTAPTSDETEY